jgi:glucokinase
MPAAPANPCRAAVVPVIEIGGTHVTAALVDTAAGRVPEATRHHAPLAADAPADALLAAIVGTARAIHPPPGAPWGVAVPGPFDYARGIARFHDVGKFDALHGVDLRRALHDGLGAPADRIRFVNDATAFTVGEWLAGAAREHARVVGITLGTGVGSAFLADGVPVTDGPTVPAHGHVHRLTAGGRPLEETVSRRAILRRYAESTGRPADRVDVRGIAERARAGDELADRVLRDAMTALGEALGPWLAAFRATAVVVGGSITGSWDLIAEPLRTATRRVAPPDIVLCAAQRPGDAALLGAARHATCPRPDRSAPGPSVPGDG